ncbi:MULTISPECIES: MarR family winged helix-turn-helix transcriptional regulator [unclassified Bacillus (in: firmicutes)]|uniref:MarR family winged helix-turn-helix transcriptional regulator n=1 Tax=unclassified Bacillus (in: firmicutes) TaxID=185979 RepID=UPI001F369B2F|nr:MULTISPECIES: MarR family transcriptional regulator [unclassified Bacillus (in: firmicutes)]WFA05234.1 MarR family transcriptional regulator [Bacillus sp. HSf4]
MENKVADALTPYHLEARQLGVLLFIKEHPYSSQKLISEKLQIDRTTMVSHVDHLETLGFVERAKNPNDRRAYSLILTEKGSDVLSSCRVLLAQAESDVLSPLNEHEKKVFKDMLLRVWSQYKK